ncbi:MAG: DUF3566 domain-containing protein [Rhodoluna sp.]|jgi:hypothetical protein|nr:DUF3566 domain-containing protein [Rhodoluna sp.]
MSIFSRNVRRSESTVKPVNLKLVKISFWSAVRFGFVVTIALGVGLVIALTLVFFILSLAGATALLKEFVGLDVTLPAVLAVALSMALFIILVGTILSGVWALIFNIVARITGGISVGFTNN